MHSKLYVSKYRCLVKFVYKNMRIYVDVFIYGCICITFVTMKISKTNDRTTRLGGCGWS